MNIIMFNLRIISKQNLNVITNITPFDEIFTGSNNKSYRQRYFLAYINNNITLENFQKCEVSNINWYSLSECLKKIRVYNLEKKEIIQNVDKILKTFRLIV